MIRPARLGQPFAPDSLLHPSRLKRYPAISAEREEETPLLAPETERLLPPAGLRPRRLSRYSLFVNLDEFEEAAFAFTSALLTQVTIPPPPVTGNRDVIIIHGHRPGRVNTSVI